ncbi:uncharacterized protein LOC118227101 isoform X2 [Anguilla anguilla]|uniref:uncharacterized protein LOC118227101 isoform X2 n=1 Tax=Anguilla anguilla TaxID=7936 RepID=UPI0015A8273D|nr:uncharacterized protein LOC118227101 isoform X2 [Anguilla anguilla]
MQHSTGTEDIRATQYSNTTQTTSQDKNRNMLVWCWLPFFFHLIGATPEICKKQSPCDAPECFEIMASPEPACTSTNYTDLCRIDRSCIEYNCDADLSCKCNGRPFELADLTKCPVKDEESISMENEVHPEETKPYEGDLSTPEVPERNNTNRTESSGSSMTPLQIAAAVVVPAVGVGAGAIAYCVWMARRMQGHRDAEQEERDPQGEPLAQDQNIMELQDMNGDGEGEVV